MKLINFLIIILFFTFSLTQGQVKLSFKNESKEVFKILKIDRYNSTHFFKNLKPGESTLPIIVSGSYPYCPVQIITEKDTVSFFPIDYMGERYYKSGKLVMLLKIEEGESKRRIEITAKR
jgi:hypothetical protein